jgi:hypothetical protein
MAAFILLKPSNLVHSKQRIKVATDFNHSNSNQFLIEPIVISNQIRRYIMSGQEKLDLMQLVESDKKNCLAFLKANNIRLNNKISMLFSDGDVDESKMDQLSFTNLWELQLEPSLVKVEFVIKRPKEEHSNITETLEILLDKIVERAWHVFPGESLDTSTTCPHFKSIKIDNHSNGINIVMVGAICYCG